MKKIVLMILVVAVLLFDSTSYARTTLKSHGRSFHKYYSGIAQQVSDLGITLNNHKYFYAKQVAVKAQVKTNGAFHEVGASILDIKEGTSVIIKVEGATISEIIIERWK